MSDPAELSCREAARLMSVKRDRSLLEDEEESLDVHWAICRSCRNFDQQLDVIAEMAKRYAVGGNR